MIPLLTVLDSTAMFVNALQLGVVGIVASSFRNRNEKVPVVEAVFVLLALLAFQAGSICDVLDRDIVENAVNRGLDLFGRVSSSVKTETSPQLSSILSVVLSPATNRVLFAIMGIGAAFSVFVNALVATGFSKQPAASKLFSRGSIMAMQSGIAVFVLAFSTIVAVAIMMRLGQQGQPMQDVVQSTNIPQLSIPLIEGAGAIALLPLLASRKRSSDYDLTSIAIQVSIALTSTRLTRLVLAIVQPPGLSLSSLKGPSPFLSLEKFEQYPTLLAISVGLSVSLLVALLFTFSLLPKTHSFLYYIVPIVLSPAYYFALHTIAQQAAASIPAHDAIRSVAHFSPAIRTVLGFSSEFNLFSLGRWGGLVPLLVAMIHALFFSGTLGLAIQAGFVQALLSYHSLELK